MPEKDPATYSLLTYVWVTGLAILGGIVNFMRKLKEGAVRKFNVTELVGELITSGFVGVLTFWLCEWANTDRLLSALFIGVSGHMGSRAIFLFERWAEAKFHRKELE